jgi:TatD DNase family protein
MDFVDTHCHLHFSDYSPDVEQVLKDARVHKVNKMICVGVSLEDSQKAVDFAASHDNVWATVGAHPHDGADFLEHSNAVELLNELSKREKVVAIGEIGLDYFHEYTPRAKQIDVLSKQLEWGFKTGLPFVFHVRDAQPQKLDASQSDSRLLRSGFAGGQAWEDFWKVVDKYPNIKGVVHCFSAYEQQLEEILSRGFYVGLNGITTFTKDEKQLEAAKKVPLNKLLLETDAPFLTPKPYRGKRCEPKHIILTAEFLANLRDEKLEDLVASTTTNALSLFGI